MNNIGKFKVGDRVIINNSTNEKALVGKKGVVKGFLKVSNNVAVEFETSSMSMNFHSCNDMCKNGHGWYCSPSELDIVTNKKFEIGDRVRFTEKAPSMITPRDILGAIGVVKGFSTITGNIAIEFAYSKTSAFLHDCFGMCASFRGWFCEDDDVTLVESRTEITSPSKENKNYTITISSNNNKEVVANLQDGKELIKTTKAMCHPTDEFDFEFGAKLAFERLIDKEIEKSVKDNTINIGDDVVVINNKSTYQTYSNWFDKFAPNYASKFTYDSRVKDGFKGIVVAKAMHEICDNELYAVESKSFQKSVILIGRDGLEKINANVKDSKK